VTLADDPENFLLHDSGVDDPDRFFMFGTLDHVKLIGDAHIFMDGTFDISPTLFMQVYTVHVLKHGRCLPVVYGLLPRKTQAIYTSFLTVISNKLNMAPRTITSDFEKALLNACQTVFPSTQLHGCFFHFKQSMFRRIQDLGLVPAYMSNDGIRKLLKLPQVLAYIPVTHVFDTFQTLKSEVTCPTISAFYEYIENNYVGKHIESTRGRGVNKKTIVSRQDPVFPIELWSVYSRINDNLPRTNNFVETWHNAFGSMLKKHPLVYELVDEFRKEHKRTVNNLIKLNTGIVYKRQPEYMILDERIRNVVKTYTKGDFTTFFDNLNLILKY
jgi:hypothetical protein